MKRLRIETVVSREECEAAGALFDRVWGMSGMVPNEVIIATVHAGGYASLAKLGDDVIGASWGFIGSHGGEHTLHSHVTGVIAQHGSTGVGEAIKRHQWAWAKARQLDSITWSFDPLVRRNGYFNLVKLGAHVIEYHEDFYGSIDDGLNRGEHTDRLIVRWAVDEGSETATGATVNHAIWTIATPEDIEELRLVDRAVAHEWRARQRAELRKAFAGGWKIAGFMSDGSYAVEKA